MESCSPPTFIGQQEKTEQEKNLRQRIEGKKQGGEASQNPRK